MPLDGASCGIKPRSVAADLLRDAAVTLWDEAPTAPKAAIKAVDELLRDLMDQRHLPFGGKVVVLGGDFRQIPPILRRVDERAVKSFTLRGLAWWRSKHVGHYALTRNMRAREDPDYADFLEELGNGTFPGSADDSHGCELHPRTVCLPASITAPFSWKAADLMDWVYTGYQSVAPADWSAFYETRAVVTPLNASAAELNNWMLEGLPASAERVSLSQDHAVVDADAPDHYTPEFMNSLDPPGMPPHELRLRPGALMMILRNYAPHKGLCNGTRVVLRGLWRRLLQVEVVTGPARGQVHLLPRIVCDSTGDDELPFTLRRLQFPLRPAWVMSINKAQGQTVSGRIGIYLPSPVFAHGQLYVACSRAVCAANVRVLADDHENRQRRLRLGGPSSDKARIYTLNLVDATLLSDTCEANAPDLGPGSCQPCCRQLVSGPGPGLSQGSHAQMDDCSAEVGEQHRLALLLPDPEFSCGRKPLKWDGAASNPLAADEWTYMEAGSAQPPSKDSHSEVLLESLDAEAVEYVSDGEDVATDATPMQASQVP